MSDRPVRLDLGAPRLGGEGGPLGQPGGMPEQSARDADVSRFRQALQGQQAGAEGAGEASEQTPHGEAQGQGDGASGRSGAFGLFGGLGSFGGLGGFSSHTGAGDDGQAQSGAEDAQGEASQEGADLRGGLASAARLPSGDSILHGLPGSPFGSAHTDPVSADSAAPRASAAPAAATTAQLVSAVAERILVSSEATGEVRVLVRQDVLPGVEVRIVQDQGRWVVDFAVTQADSLGVLQSAGERIAAELSRRLRRAVEVRVADPRSDAAQQQAEIWRAAEDAADGVAPPEGAAPLASGLPSLRWGGEETR